MGRRKKQLYPYLIIRPSRHSVIRNRAYLFERKPVPAVFHYTYNFNPEFFRRRIREENHRQTDQTLHPCKNCVRCLPERRLLRKTCWRGDGFHMRRDDQGNAL